MPFSVKRITHAFLQHEKKFIYNNKILEPSPSSLKELVNRKYRYKLQGNCTKPKKWKQNKPQPFRVLSPELRKYTNGEIGAVCCYKIPGTQTTLLTHFVSLTLFTTIDLAKGQMALTGTQWGPFKKTFSTWRQCNTVEHTRERKPPWADTPLFFFQPTLWLFGGKWWLILGLFTRAPTEQGTLTGASCLTRNWSFGVISQERDSKCICF